MSENAKSAQLENLQTSQPVESAPELLDLLPQAAGVIRLGDVPKELAGRLFETFRLEIRYDRRTQNARCQVTLSGAAIEAQPRTACSMLAAQEPGDDHFPVAPICSETPAGVDERGVAESRHHGP